MPPTHIRGGSSIAFVPLVPILAAQYLRQTSRCPLHGTTRHPLSVQRCFPIVPSPRPRDLVFHAEVRRMGHQASTVSAETFPDCADTKASVAVGSTSPLCGAPVIQSLCRDSIAPTPRAAWPLGTGCIQKTWKFNTMAHSADEGQKLKGG